MDTTSPPLSSPSSSTSEQQQHRRNGHRKAHRVAECHAVSASQKWGRRTASASKHVFRLRPLADSARARTHIHTHTVEGYVINTARVSILIKFNVIIKYLWGAFASAVPGRLRISKHFPVPNYVGAECICTTSCEWPAKNQKNKPVAALPAESRLLRWWPLDHHVSSTLNTLCSSRRHCHNTIRIKRSHYHNA